jgi:carbamate kinase
MKESIGMGQRKVEPEKHLKSRGGGMPHVGTSLKAYGVQALVIDKKYAGDYHAALIKSSARSARIYTALILQWN